MCRYNKEENRILGLPEDELCSMEKIYGTDYKCHLETQKVCEETEKLLREVPSKNA